jgi:RNA polymerase sigma-B factor
VTDHAGAAVASRCVATAGVDDRTLLRRWRREDDRDAREALLQRHMPLAKRLAVRYVHGHGTSDDVHQVAAIGLMKAIDRFDPERGVAFSTFAVPTIAGELKRFLRDTSWSVRVPRDLQELALRVTRASQQLEREHGHPPSVGELAEAVDADAEEVLEALQAADAHHALSLDAPRRDDDEASAPFVEVLGCDDGALLDAEHRAVLGPLLSRLSDRDREILRLRYAEDLTQSEIGERLGLSQMHISRLIRRALSRAAA